MLLLASIGGVVVISLVALGFKDIIDKKVETEKQIKLNEKNGEKNVD